MAGKCVFLHTSRELLKWRLALKSKGRLALLCMHAGDTLKDDQMYPLCNEFDAVAIVLCNFNATETKHPNCIQIQKSKLFAKLSCAQKKVALFQPDNIANILTHQSIATVHLSQDHTLHELPESTSAQFLLLVHVYVFMALILRPRVVLIDHAIHEETCWIQYALSSLEIQSSISCEQKRKFYQNTCTALLKASYGSSAALHQNQVNAYAYKYQPKDNLFIKKNCGIWKFKSSKVNHAFQTNFMDDTYVSDSVKSYNGIECRRERMYKLIPFYLDISKLSNVYIAEYDMYIALDKLTWYTPSITFTGKQIIGYAAHETNRFPTKFTVLLLEYNVKSILSTTLYFIQTIGFKSKQSSWSAPAEYVPGEP